MALAQVHGFVVALPATVDGLRRVDDVKVRPDVQVCVGDVPGTDEPAVGGQRLDSGLLLSFRRLADGAFVVLLDEQPTFWLEAGASQIRLAAWTDLTVQILRDQVLALAAELRDWTAIHATTVRIGGTVVSIAGPSGAGKSSLAGELAREGATLLAEDVTALTAGRAIVRAARGPTIVRRRPHRRGGRGTNLEEKQDVPIVADPDDGELGLLVILDPSGQSAAERSRAPVLLTQLFVPFMNDPWSLTRHLDLAALAARSVPTLELATQSVSLDETYSTLWRQLDELRDA